MKTDNFLGITSWNNKKKSANFMWYDEQNSVYCYNS